jgi:hypothetical protein
MIKIYYDPVSQGMYQSDIHKTIPSTSVEITEIKRRELLAGESTGMVISVVDGVVTLVDKMLSEEEIRQSEIFWCNSELLVADNELDKVQDSDPKAIGTVSDWRTYRKALRAWPENKNFPKQEFRPKSPISKE